MLQLNAFGHKQALYVVIQRHKLLWLLLRTHYKHVSCVLQMDTVCNLRGWDYMSL